MFGFDSNIYDVTDDNRTTGKCYICGNDMSNSNESEEHILQNALGGKLKSKRILCDVHNDQLNNEIDKFFVKRFEIIMEGLSMKKERNNNANVNAIIKNIFESREMYLKKGKVIPKNPIYNDEENTIYAPNERIGKSYREKILKEYPNIENPIIKTEEYKKYLGYFGKAYSGITLNFDIDSSDPVIYKGLAKIVAGFATLNGIQRFEMPEIIDIENKKIKDEIQITDCLEFNVFPLEELSQYEEYPLHILQLITIKEELICRIGLFSTFYFDILLNKSFDRIVNVDYIFSLGIDKQITLSQILCDEEGDLNEERHNEYCEARFSGLNFKNKNSLCFKTKKINLRTDALKNEIFLNIFKNMTSNNEGLFFRIDLRKIFSQDIIDNIKKIDFDYIDRNLK